MKKTATSLDCLFHSDSLCFLASGHLIALCSSCGALIFFPVIWCTGCVLLFLLKKKRRNVRLWPSGLPNWTAPSFFFMPLCLHQGSRMKLFVGRQHQGNLFCLVKCKVNRRGRREIGKCSPKCDVSERHERQTEAGSSCTREKKNWRWKETRQRQDSKDVKIQTRARADRQTDRQGIRAEQRQDGRRYEDNGADWSKPRLEPIRIKLAGPWQRLGRTVGHEERGGEVGRGKGGRISRWLKAND